MYINALCKPQICSTTIFFLIFFLSIFKLAPSWNKQTFAKIDFEIRVQHTLPEKIGY